MQVMENLKAILEAGGGSFENVVKTTVLLADMGDFAAVNEIYGEHSALLTSAKRAAASVKCSLWFTVCWRLFRRFTTTL